MNMLRSFLNEDQTEILKEIRDVSYETLTRGKDKNGIPYLKHIFELHYKIFGETCSNCPGKITGYIQKLKNFNTNIKMEIIKSEFQLQEGVIIPIAGTSDVYSKHNLTDEIALKLLAENPNRKSLFSKVPENLEQLIEEYISELEVKGDDNKDGDNQDDTLVSIGNDKVTVEEALSLLEIINIKTKANTVVGVGKKIKELSPELLEKLAVLVSELVSKKQPLTQTTEGVKTIDELKAEHDAALTAFQELEVAGTEDEKAVAFKALEDAQIALEEAEKLINKGE
jgi:hypothetical protein